MSRCRENYRKAEKGDVSCQECVYSAETGYRGERIRCAPTGLYVGYSVAVSRTGTCDEAAKRKVEVPHG